MKSKTFIIIILFIIELSINTYSQQNPSGISWKYIDTGIYQIIFPEEITFAGQRVANLLVHYEKYNYNSLNTHPRKIPVVLINQNIEANGFVSIAPFYSHWYTTPSSFDGIEWFKGLAIHEGRHMTQFNMIKDGAGKGAWRVLFGDVGSLLFYGLYIPPWFLEGDAVVMETALTKAGRGRQPFFSLWQRGLELSGERYSYYKNYLGSYDSLSPRSDHYRLGYLLCSYIQRHYGVDIWDRVLRRTGEYFLFYTFDSSLQHETGRTITELYNDALNEYNLIWNKQLTEINISYADIKTAHSKDKFQSYLYPFLDESETLKALFFSRDNRIMLVKINKDKTVINIKQMPVESISGMYMNERSVSGGGNRILWCENIPDPRWGYRSFSDLKMLDTVTGETFNLTSKRKFIASGLSENGKQIAAIEFTPDLKYHLSIINAENKNESSLEMPEDLGHLFDPSISNDGNMIAISAISDKGNAIFIYDKKEDKTLNITGYTFNESFKTPVFYKNYILYVSDYSGIDNIYAIDIVKKNKFQVTSRKLGAYYPAVKTESGTLIFNDYSINGHSIASISLEPAKWTPINNVRQNKIDTIDKIISQESVYNNHEIDTIPDKQYTVKNYYPLINSINIYGWIPYFDSTDSEFMFSIVSRDILHTTDIYASYIHNFNEKTAAAEAVLSYKGLYPVFSLNASYGDRAIRIEDEGIVDHVKWSEKRTKGVIELPLDFSKGIHSTTINCGFKNGYIKISDKTRSDYNIYNDINIDGDLFYNEYFFIFSHFQEKALSSVTHGTGQEFNISYTHTPYNSDYKGNLFSSALSLYFPGITDTQGLSLKGTYEFLEYKNYIFKENYLFPRGYDSIRYKYFTKVSIDYAFPIVNLSFNIWKLFYFKRVNGDLFFDYGVGKNYDKYDLYRSAGFELTAEQNLLSNLYLAIEAGFRYSYCFDSNERKYELILTTPVY